MFDKVFIPRYHIIGINTISDAQYKIVLKVIVIMLEHKGIEHLVRSDRGDNRLLPNQANARPCRLVGSGDCLGSESSPTSSVGLHRPSQDVIDVFDRQGGREKDDILRFRRTGKELDCRLGHTRTAKKVI